MKIVSIDLSIRFLKYIMKKYMICYRKINKTIWR